MKMEVNSFFFCSGQSGWLAVPCKFKKGCWRCIGEHRSRVAALKREAEVGLRNYNGKTSTTNPPELGGNHPMWEQEIRHSQHRTLRHHAGFCSFEGAYKNDKAALKKILKSHQMPVIQFWNIAPWTWGTTIKRSNRGRLQVVRLI